MSAITSTAIGLAPAAGPFRFGQAVGGDANGGPSVRWLLVRNCSLAPRQLLLTYLTLCAVTLSIASLFWLHGASLVMPFAGAELLTVGVLMLLYGQHATDGERIDLQPGRLTVEQSFGRHVERVDFEPAWVRVEPRTGDRSLIELSGQGRRIAVGRFVRPELRRQLADELRWALRRWPLGAARDES
jgi:uncharacterized membrane protein